MKVKAITFFTLFFYIFTINYQAINEDKYSIVFNAIDTIIKNDIENGFTSAQIAVIKDGKLIYQNSWGKLNSYTEDLKPNPSSPKTTLNTLYDLASNTKMYSANYAIQYLSEHPINGKTLNIDTKLVDFFGEKFVSLTEDIKIEGSHLDIELVKQYKSEITIRDILCHRAGFPSSPPYPFKYYDYEIPTTKTEVLNVLYPGPADDEKTRDNTLQCIFKTPVIYQHGTKVEYSDTDFMIATYIIEKHTGKYLNDFLKETFWKSMELDHITFTPLKYGFTKDDSIATELQGNTREGNQYFPGIRTHTIQGEVHDEKSFYCLGGCSGHAGLFSSASNLAKLASLMIDGTYNGIEYFSEETIKLFTTNDDPNHDEWGIGWYRQGKNKDREWLFGNLAPEDTIGHQGWTGTSTMIDRKNKLVVIFLTNKINSPITDEKVSPDKFNGNWYTTGRLYFANQLIYHGFLHESIEETKKAVIKEVEGFIQDRKKDMEDVENLFDNHPSIKAYNSVLKSLEDIKKSDEKKSGGKILKVPSIFMFLLCFAIILL